MEFFLGTAVAWWGKDKRHFAFSGWLAVCSAAGLLVLAFPFAKSNPIDMGEVLIIFIRKYVLSSNADYSLKTKKLRTVQ